MARKNPPETAARINLPNRHGTNEFFKAIENNDTRDVRRLLREGADVDFRSRRQSFFSSISTSIPYAPGSTPLHAAAQQGSIEITLLLLDHGADPNAKNTEGCTPLDSALMGHAYYKNKAAPTSALRKAFRRRAERAGDKRDDFAAVIETLLSRGAQLGLYPLPEEFGGKPRPAGPKPPGSLF